MAKTVTVLEAAAVLGCSPQFVRMGMQQGVLKIGTAVKLKGWAYNIQQDKLSEAVGHDIEKELKQLRGAANIR